MNARYSPCRTRWTDQAVRIITPRMASSLSRFGASLRRTGSKDVPAWAAGAIARRRYDASADIGSSAPGRDGPKRDSAWWTQKAASWARRLMATGYPAIAPRPCRARQNWQLVRLAPGRRGSSTLSPAGRLLCWMARSWCRRRAGLNERRKLSGKRNLSWPVS